MKHTIFARYYLSPARFKLFRNMKSAIIALEGINTCSLGYVVREITIHLPDFGRRTYHFAPPENHYWTPHDRKSIAHYKAELGGNDLFKEIPGELPHTMIPSVLGSVEDRKIYTAGYLALQFLEDELPYSWIEDLYSRYGFKFPKFLKHSEGCSLRHQGRYCSESKAICMLGFVDMEYYS